MTPNNCIKTERRANGPSVVILESTPCDDVALLGGMKHGQRITVCIPARNEAATVGAIVSEIVTELMGPFGLVDELLVLDDGSTDDTAQIARRSGAQVINVAETLSAYGPGAGKGNALWAGMHASTGDIIVFCDADPPQLFDLVADPFELVNLAADPTHAATVAGFVADVRTRWNTAELRAAVVANQHARRTVDMALRRGRHTAWDHQPIVDATQQYMRNHLDLNDVESGRRLPG